MTAAAMKKIMYITFLLGLLFDFISAITSNKTRTMENFSLDAGNQGSLRPLLFTKTEKNKNREKIFRERQQTGETELLVNSFASSPVFPPSQNKT